MVEQFPDTIDVRELSGSLRRLPLAPHHDGSSSVTASTNLPGWLVKLYRGSVEAERVEALVALPDTLPDADRHVLRTSTSWPVARVVEGERTVGVIMPQAPSSFTAQIRGVSQQRREVYLEIDLLATTDRSIARRGLTVPRLVDRLRICRDLALVATVFERHDIVYGDWSYTNAFWSVRDAAAYVIDVDSCSFGRTASVTTPSFEDPLLAPGAPITTTTDRFRVALLVARCLTGVRVAADLLAALNPVAGALDAEVLHRVVAQSLTAAERDARPTSESLLAAVDRALMGPPSLLGEPLTVLQRPVKDHRH